MASDHCTTVAETQTDAPVFRSALVRKYKQLGDGDIMCMDDQCGPRQKNIPVSEESTSCAIILLSLELQE
jgi:hypothetical protein